MKIGGRKVVHYNFTQNYMPVFLYFKNCKDYAGIFISGKYNVYVVDTILLNGTFFVCWID
jgi:hypothetical protein